MKHKYLLGIRQWFGYETQFVIEAENKNQAIEIGMVYVKRHSPFCSGGYDYNSVRCIKKLKKRGKSI